VNPAVRHSEIVFPGAQRLVHAVVPETARRFVGGVVSRHKTGRCRQELRFCRFLQEERLHARMRNRLADGEHAVAPQDHGFGRAERIGDAIGERAAADEIGLCEERHFVTETGAEAVRDPHGFGGTGIGRDVTWMAPYDRLRVGPPAVDRQMHRRFQRRPAVSGALHAVAVELDEFIFRHQPERTPRRDQDSLAARNACADMAEAFHDAEMMQHAAARQHVAAQLT
jgi:hypothetical protein